MLSFRTRALVGAMALLAPAALLVSTAPANASSMTSTSKVTIFHGIPGVNVNVYVNGKKLLTDFKPGKFAGPLTLAAGSYKIDITSYSADMKAHKKTKDVIGPAHVKVGSGHNYTIAAYLTTAGKPTAGVFDNNISMLAAGKGRVTVVHIADAPTVSVDANGATLIPALSNGGKAGADVPAATYKVAVKAGMTTVFSTSLPVTAGANTIVYAYGTYPKTFAVAVQKITGLGK